MSLVIMMTGIKRNYRAVVFDKDKGLDVKGVVRSWLDLFDLANIGYSDT